MTARPEIGRFVEELREFVRFPSISTDPAHAADVAACGRWLARHLRGIGMDRVDLVATQRHPVVVASWRRRPTRPTLLIYGHYDVQPADPVTAWRWPPFQPVVRDGFLHGRGASDDKGQLFAHVKALERALRSGGPTVNVVCLFEGEEEVGSPSLAGFLRANRSRLAADVAVVSDTRMLGPGRPTITYSLRGGVALEVRLRRLGPDLHSGAFGGAVANPLQALSELMARLHAPGGRVAVPGLYARVRRPGSTERSFMARTGPTDGAILRAARASAAWGESGWSLYERTTVRPALTVNGMGGGYAGPGGKGVIPAQAWAKLSIRLVPDQDPQEILRQVVAHLRRSVPPGLTLTVRPGLSVRPVEIDRGHPAMRAAARACTRVFGAVPSLVRSGGSIPAAGLFREHLGIETVLMGFALPDDGMHAPNERFSLANFRAAIHSSLAFMEELARLPKGRRWAGAAGAATAHRPALTG